MKDSKILMVCVLVALALYVSSYVILRANKTYMTCHSFAGGEITQYVAFDWRQSPKWESKKDYLENIDDPIAQTEAENDGGISYYKPLVFLEEEIRGIGRGRFIEDG